MCGIYGTTINYSESQVKAKLERTGFRGPDQMGWETYQDRNSQITFGHNRLSIIDLDPRSNQPFTYADTIHIVFNGEIYNFRALKEQLIKKEYVFKTTSDTEVICAAYLEYGTDCVSYFNGMFAFVIYDANKQLLYGAKDRLGQKPFYYYLNGSDFEFASQISSIQLYHPDLTISRKGIQEYLAWNSVPSPHTIFNEVKKLEDGHWFTYNLRDYTFKTHQYWDIDLSGTQRFQGNFETAQKELEQLMTDAVQIRLFADVPVGVFLSGGIDSSLITALATKNTTEKIKTFSVKFNEKGFDESAYAQKVADHLKTDHHVIECDYAEGIDLIENFTYYYDEPFGDSSAIPSMLLAKHTRKQVTVSLSGDGGDEAFLGYHRYEWIDRNKKYFAFPKALRNGIAKVLTISSAGNRAKILANLIGKKNIEEAYLSTLFKPNAPWLVLPNQNDNFEELKYLMHNNKNILERAGDFDLKTYLNWDINTKVDRASMAYSLEARSPLLDYRVIEYAQALPTNFKYVKGNQKRILKEVLYKHVPREIFDRPKSGFSMPFNVWFREDLKDYVMTELSDNNLREIPGIKPEVVSKLIDQHMKSTWDHFSLIWKLLVLRQWLAKNGKGLTIQ